MKSTLYLIFIFFIMLNSSYAQQISTHADFLKFKFSFLDNFKYPSQLKDHGISTTTLMLVQFGNDGTIKEIKFSDSAQQPFIDEVNSVKKKIDFKYVYNDVTKINKENRVVLIPIQIDVKKTGASGHLPQILETAPQNLYNFSGKPICGNYNIYPMIYILSVKFSQ
ncbi:PTS sugar transporter [Sphingobacterium spiritivorum]|uniref:PTS sugar transporter n=1 Tax=Sphingobacterium spiritivorum TaxID=258 RepID=UPI003DA5D9C4